MFYRKFFYIFSIRVSNDFELLSLFKTKNMKKKLVF